MMPILYRPDGCIDEASRRSFAPSCEELTTSKAAYALLLCAASAMAAGKSEPETFFIPATFSGPEATIKIPVGAVSSFSASNAEALTNYARSGNRGDASVGRRSHRCHRHRRADPDQGGPGRSRADRGRCRPAEGLAADRVSPTALQPCHRGRRMPPRPSSATWSSRCKLHRAPCKSGRIGWSTPSE